MRKIIKTSLLSFTSASMLLTGCSSMGGRDIERKGEITNAVSAAVSPTSENKTHPDETIVPVQEPVQKSEKRFDLILRNAPIHQVYRVFAF